MKHLKIYDYEDDRCYEEIFLLLYKVDQVLSFVPFFLNYFWNAWILVDLYLMIRSPFSSRNKRVGKAYLVIITYSMLVFIAVVS